MRTRHATILLGAALLLAAPDVSAGKKPPPEPPDLAIEHRHPSGRFSLRTPKDWTVAPSATRPEAFEAASADLLIRFVYRSGENGYDSLHADCMLDLLAGAMETAPNVKYEYDFVGGALASRRVLDSAFRVRYDEPVHGQREWRQRNITIVGGGDSLCVISYVPADVWKKSPETRVLVDAVLGSVKFSD